ncbi:hypothetical protein acdb102_49330 [Acidothermaceae bacterium B102]|nr:hypothetical protein acdb102_49330 [Acidothermaceae bacterium B102]
MLTDPSADTVASTVCHAGLAVNAACWTAGEAAGDEVEAAKAPGEADADVELFALVAPDDVQPVATRATVATRAATRRTTITSTQSPRGTRQDNRDPVTSG